MSNHPSPSLVAELQVLILKTFDVSPEEAHAHASGFAALAEDWGNPETATKLDWRYRVKKDLGEKLRWKSEMERERFHNDQEQRVKAYNAFIQKSGGA